MWVKRNRFVMLLALILSILALAACSSNEPTNEPADEKPAVNTGTATPSTPEPITPQEPVTITIAWPWGEPEYEARFGGIAEKLKDSITINMIQAQGTKENLQELFAAKTVPDIIFANHGLQPLEELDTLMPIDDLMAKHGFDLARINPFQLAYVRSIDTKNRLVGLPDGGGFATFFYNKDIFDLFGVPYPDPKKPMTWDEMLDIAQRMTATRGGKTYVGFEFTSGPYAPLDEFPANATDPDTGELRLTKDPAFTKYFELLKRYYSIPGIKEAYGTDMFMAGSGAMTIRWNAFMKSDWKENESFKNSIDILPMPVWPEQPNLSPVASTTAITINKYSEQHDAAFQVLAEYYSEENQIRMIRPAHAYPSVSDMEIVKQWAADVPGYQGKNMEAIFEVERPSYQPRKSPWDAYIGMPQALEKFMMSDMDVVKFLREWEEEAAGKVKDAMDKYKQ
ncbi:extracellular solute-binding protein [Paenibacillus sp. J5C_2022]|uniref:ABC transporter substrate-binding protein n=1 Tax=Paenibacillus sp. J5C2022 TaxID=2977129 RepID=UPI0021D0AFD3|nr:extracellular solute-binding protein [Paenibacillus sp. J5C2022]MCU6708851.1 extracellular solute-binding protein [Paenibacillus sp. J5C2022]